MSTALRTPPWRSEAPVCDTRVEALADAVDDLFRGSGTSAGRVGIELELMPLRTRSKSWPSWVPINEVRDIAAGVPGISYEPGGQLELSPAPEASARDALTVLERDVRTLEQRAARRDITLLAAGLDPWNPAAAVPLQLTTARYLALQRHLDAISPAGRQMMLRSAALQVAVDLEAGGAGAEQWRVANLAAPVLAAAFANSPQFAEGRRRANGGRLAMWEAVDPSRSGSSCLDPDEDPRGAYLDFALRAEAIPLQREDRVGLPFRLPFVTWIGAGGERPDAADIAHHLSTLFPPVRPRGAYLEVRVLDSLPARHREIAVHVVSLLLSDPAARTAALALLDDGRNARRWRAAVNTGVRGAALRREAMALLALAVAAARRSGDGIADAIEEFAALFTSARRAPADDFSVPAPQEALPWLSRCTAAH